MEEQFDKILKTLLDYHCDFEQNPRIEQMIRAAGEKAGLFSQTRQNLDDDTLDNIAAAGDTDLLHKKPDNK
jgi:hypothetical protein